MAARVGSLPVAEKDAALLALLRGDDPHLRAELLRRFRGAASTRPGNRTAGDLLAAAEARWKDRVRAKEELRGQAAAERERARARRLASLAAEGDRAWARVDALIETKKPAEYDRAVDHTRTCPCRLPGKIAASGMGATDLSLPHHTR
jgi:hypothetical protein